MSLSLSVKQKRVLEQHRYILQKLAKLSPKDRKKVFKTAPKQLFEALNIVFTLLAQDKLNLSKHEHTSVKKHKRVLKNFGDLKHHAIKRKVQKGGAWTQILGTVLPIVANVLSSLF